MIALFQCVGYQTIELSRDVIAHLLGQVAHTIIKGNTEGFK